MEEETKNPLAPPEPETPDSPEEVQSENADPDASETPEETAIPEESPAPEPEPVESPEYNEPVDSEPTPETSPEPAKTPVSEEIQSADASSETPKILSAEPIPEEPLSTEPKKKSRKPLIIVFTILLILSLGVCAVLFFMPEFVTNLFGKIESQNSQETVEPEIPEASKLRLAGNSLSDFDLTFLKLENSKENKIYSPLSIKYALAMLKDGAAGETKTQIENLIGDYKPKAYLDNENRSLANAMFVRNQSKDIVLDSYISTIKEKYYGEVIFDSFSTPDNLNNWVKNKTLSLIPNLIDGDISEFDFILVNALGIDMNWNNQIQCASYGDGTKNGDIEANVPCKYYDVKYAHEKYSHGIAYLDTDHNEPLSFNDKEIKNYATIGVSANRYDIIKEIGEDEIRKTVAEAYENYVKEVANESHNGDIEEAKSGLGEFDLNEYIEELSQNYNSFKDSTDFYFNVTDSEKVFAKDLREYNGSTLEYVGIMPKSESLENYVTNLTAEKTQTLIDGLKDASKIENYSDGVITKLNGKIPFYNFDFSMDLIKELEPLGITDVFDSQKADLTNLVGPKGEYISAAEHKANIDFSNEGIKAAAATWVGGMGAGGDWDYKWDVPVEEIDLTFDKPFLFLIRDKATGEIWFTGTVYEI